MHDFILTSESVTEGHPDKICDGVADAVLDAYLAIDPNTRINCEVLCKADRLVLAGEVTTGAEVNRKAVAQDFLRAIGYDDPNEPFSASNVEIYDFFTAQSTDIARGVDRVLPAEQGAGDQGMMFGYASRETPELMPLPLLLAHRITAALASDRKSGRAQWMRPDGKAQVSVRYLDGVPAEVTTVVVSIQHAAGQEQAEIQRHIEDQVLPGALGTWMRPGVRVLVNPTGRFVVGGPMADSGLTGRKIIVDTYGGAARHGGGSFSGKDASKVDRSAAYFCRWVAKRLVHSGVAQRLELQVAYAIGRAEPVSLSVETFGTGSQADAMGALAQYDFRPAAIVERLQLKRPVFSQTTNYGHFGKPQLAWEQV